MTNEQLAKLGLATIAFVKHLEDYYKEEGRNKLRDGTTPLAVLSGILAAREFTDLEKRLDEFAANYINRNDI